MTANGDKKRGASSYWGQWNPDGWTTSKQTTSEKGLEAGRRRRRIEDIKQAAALESEVLVEVWDA